MPVEEKLKCVEGLEGLPARMGAGLQISLEYLPDIEFFPRRLERHVAHGPEDRASVEWPVEFAKIQSRLRYELGSLPSSEYLLSSCSRILSGSPAFRVH